MTIMDLLGTNLEKRLNLDQATVLFRKLGVDINKLGIPVIELNSPGEYHTWFENLKISPYVKSEGNGRESINIRITAKYSSCAKCGYKVPGDDIWMPSSTSHQKIDITTKI